MIKQIKKLIQYNSQISIHGNEFLQNRIILPMFFCGGIACLITDFIQRSMGVNNSLDSIMLHALTFVLFFDTFLTLFFKKLMIKLINPTVIFISAFFIAKIANGLYGQNENKILLLATIVGYTPIAYVNIFMFIKKHSIKYSFLFYFITLALCLFHPSLWSTDKSSLIEKELILSLIGSQPLFIFSCRYFSNIKEFAITTSYNEKIDVLTGINNRRSIQKILDEKELNNTLHRSSFLLIDIDNFKIINDTYGHNIGDEILKLVSSTISNNLREIDFAGRWGGEEFLVILNNDNPEISLKISERIRASIESIQHQYVKNITISGGLLINPINLSQKDAIDNADKALYIAKRNGKNQIHVFNSII